MILSKKEEHNIVVLAAAFVAGYGKNEIDAIHEAQAICYPRKSKLSPSDAKKLSEEIGGFLKSLDNIKNPNQEVLNKLTEQITSLQAKVDSLNTQLHIEQKQETVSKEVIEKVAEEIFFKLAEPMISSICSAVTERVSHQSPDKIDTPDIKRLTNQTAQAVEDVSVKKQSVLIVGLLPVQENEIRSKYQKHFDLRFKRSEDNLQHLRGAAQNVDMTIVNTKFVSHKHTDCLKGCPNVVYVNCGVSGLKQTLDEVVAKTQLICV